MTDEIIKLYENAGIKPVVRNIATGKGYYIEHQRIEEYPPFTAEKQLKLLKEITKLYSITVSHSIDAYYIKARSKNGSKFRVNHYFDEGLASLINALWQDLTEQEQQQIKEILQ